MTNNNTDAYVPGVCNINSTEIAYRRKSGYILLVISMILAGVVIGLGLPVWTRLGLYFPIFVTAVCFLQVKYKFCVKYGAAGKQNADEGDKIAQDIVDAVARQLDAARTRKIKLQGASIALVVTVVLLLLPM
jgi:hypothetical protein